MDHAQYFNQSSIQAANLRLHYLSQLLREQTGSVVQYGILRGYPVGVSQWAEVAVGGYLLGTYEIAICAILEALGSPGKVLIDLGAADGIFGIGLVRNNVFGRSLCFEMDEPRRQAIQHRAAEMGLADRVAVYGQADRNLPAILSEHGGAPTERVILCDIEGAEFELFDSALLEQLAGSHVIIEIHDFMYPDPQQAARVFDELSARASEHFHVYEIRDGLRDIRNIPLLRHWSDWDAWLMCVEARYRMMRWLWLEPKSQPRRSSHDIDRLILDYQRRIFAV
ncbi:FkbM family methyltransferase [Burkholderia metallica]|uniref:FkbM family methyltransferase n=1 Tax=Burkholderia metallica TaxID=488729 RepID=UPI000D1A23D2|nr:FkbM family methyltransferase [Burkholderia metallica]